MTRKKIGFYLLIAFYFLAGLNHFRDPQFYLGLIPPYFEYPEFINYASGIAEMSLALGLLIKPKWAVYGIVIMLLAFIPSHVYFIQIGGCIPNGLCVPAWIGWARLLVIHPLLILWAWSYRGYKLN